MNTRTINHLQSEVNRLYSDFWSIFYKMLPGCLERFEQNVKTEKWLREEEEVDKDFFFKTIVEDKESYSEEDARGILEEIRENLDELKDEVEGYIENYEPTKDDYYVEDY